MSVPSLKTYHDISPWAYDVSRHQSETIQYTIKSVLGLQDIIIPTTGLSKNHDASPKPYKTFTPYSRGY